MLFHYLPKLSGLFFGKGIQWAETKTEFYCDKYIPIERDQGEFLYLLARSLSAKSIVEFGTSFGISTIYLATAAKDNGGVVIGTELVPEKVTQTRKNIADAGLETYVDIRGGDALETLKHLNQPINLVLMAGWAQLLDPSIKPGGIVLSDNVGMFKEDLKPYVAFLQNSASGYRSATINLKSGTLKSSTEFSIKVS